MTGARSILATLLTFVSVGVAHATIDVVDFRVNPGNWFTYGAYVPYGLPSQPTLTGSVTIDTTKSGSSAFKAIDYLTGSRTWGLSDISPSSYAPSYEPDSNFEIIFKQGSQGNTGNNFIAADNTVGINDERGGGIACNGCFSITSIASSPNSPAPPKLEGSVSVTTYPDRPWLIGADFITNSGVTLTQAANTLGYSSFEWQQTVTSITGPVPFRAADAPNTPLIPPFLDPVAGGYTYQSGYDAYPYYYPLAKLSDYITSNNTVLTFGDDPSDQCFGPLAIFQPLCEGNIYLDGEMHFTTNLVGVRADGSVGSTLFSFNWESNFSGTFGGVSKLNNQDPDPGTGSGGVTLLSEEYTVSVAPEPSTWALMIAGFGMAGAALRFGRRSGSPATA